MMRLIFTISILFFAGISSSTAQNKAFDIKHLSPVIQVFGSTYLNLKNGYFNYGIGRAHLGFKYKFNNKWSSKIIIDRGRATSVGDIIVSDSAGNVLNVQNTSRQGAYYTMFLKYASLKWKVNKKLSLEGGAILENHYITQERFWELRYVAQTFQDLYWHIPSSDLGFIAYYKLNKTLSLDAAITNGEGPRVSQDSFGKLKYAVGLDIKPFKKLQTRLYYHNRQSGEINSATEQLFSAFAGYKVNGIFKIGGEFNYMLNLNNIKDLDSYGYSAYAIYSIKNDFDIFVRFDQVFYNKPLEDDSPFYEASYSIKTGISYSPFEMVNLSLNYQNLIQSKNNINLLIFSMEFKI